MTIRKFKIFDLLVLSILAILVDIVAYIATGGELFAFYLMLSVPIVLIAYVRWNYAGLSLNAVLIILHMILYGNDLFSDVRLLLGYCLGILSLATAMVWFIFIKPDKIRTNWLITVLYYLTGYAAMFLITIATSLIVSGSVDWSAYLVRHGLNLVLGMVVIIIASVQKSFMVDMKLYLLKQIKEKQDEGK